MVSASARPLAPSILFITEAFPNRVQPYVLNMIEAAMEHGAEVTIVAHGRLGGTYDRRVDQLGLLTRTLYYRFETPADILRGLKPYLSPFSRGAQEKFMGLLRLLKDGSRRHSDVKALVKAIIRSALLAQGRFDLIHANYLFGAHEYVLAARALGIPLLTSFLGFPTRGGTHLLHPRKAAEVFEQGRLFLVCTRFAKEQLESAGCPADKIDILPQGCRLEDFPFRARPYPREGPVVLLTVARLSTEKGHRYAIEAVRKLRDRGRRVEYRIVGKGYEKRNLEDFVQEIRAQDYVRFLGELNDIELQKQYDEAHIFILPSIPDQDEYHTETQGVVIQEAQASGVLVVATRIGGIPECVDDGRSAFLVPARDPEALAAQIDVLLDHPDQWPEWQQRGRAWVEEHFDMKKIGRRLWEIYQEAIKTHRCGAAR